MLNILKCYRKLMVKKMLVVNNIQELAELPAYFYISRAPGNKGDIIRIKKGKEFKENGESL